VLRPYLPALTRTYGLRWAHLEAMPLGELQVYLWDAFGRPSTDEQPGNENEMTELWHTVLTAAGAW
jgi:hypothetical protein